MKDLSWRKDWMDNWVLPDPAGDTRIYIYTAANKLLYRVAGGVYAEEPLPKGLNDDELKAWALAIYRMGGHRAE